MNPSTPRRAPNRLHLPESKIIRLYSDGMSEKVVAEKVNVSRSAIRRVLIENKIPIRNRSDAMFLRMSKATKAERLRITKAAHDSVRGKPKSDFIKRKIALGKSRLRGAGEKILSDKFRASGYSVEEQFPFEIYNIDLLISGLGRIDRCGLLLKIKSAISKAEQISPGTRGES